MTIAGKKLTRFNPWVVAWAAGVIIFAIIVAWQDRGLTFFWDEWDVIWATMESPYYGVLQDNGGNFFPLSRIIYAIELAVFGSWYPGYVVVAALLFGATAFAFNKLMDDGTLIRRIALSSFSVIYLSSTGVLFASSMGFMLKWALSPLFAIIAATYFVRSRGENVNQIKMLVLGWLFFFLTWAAFSSAIVLMALLMIGLIHVAPTGELRSSSPSLRINLSLAILVLSIVGVVLGIYLAGLNPPINPLTGTAQSSVDGVLSMNIANAVVLAVASTLAGLFSVAVAIPLHNNDVNAWLIIAFRDYLAVIVAILAILLAGIYALRKSLPGRYLILLFMLFLAANTFISVTRSPFIHRYQTLLIPTAILILLLVIKWLTDLRLPIARNLLLAIIVGAACISVWHIATNALPIANVERQRSIADSAILKDPSRCVNEATMALDQIAPTIAAKEVCAITYLLDQRSWITERQDVPRG